jgi:integrase
MGRPRKRPLPRGVHERRSRRGDVAGYEIDFRDQGGVRRRERAGATIDDAVRLLARRREEVAAGTYDPGAGTGEQTLATYAERWIAMRLQEGVRTAPREDQILRDHVLPHLGAMPLAAIRPPHVAGLVRALEARGRMAPKSILNAHGTLSALLARARFDGLVSDNAAKGLPRGILPRNVRTRDVGAWTRDELEALVADERVPEEHRVAYAIASFTGARVGEIAGMRWSDLDVRAAPLWRWALRTQYDREPLKTDRPRDVPIHPELQRLLAAWRLDGWTRLRRRHARPDDLVVPRAEPLVRTIDGLRVETWVHSKESLGAKAVHRHAAAIGIDPAGRDFHSFRRAMITCARVDGVREDLLEQITHNARGTMIDAYTYFGWPELCAAIAGLKLAVRRGATVTRIAAARDGSGSGHALGHADANGPETVNDLGAVLMEAPGVEGSAHVARPGISAEIARSDARRPRRASPADRGGSSIVPVRVPRVTARGGDLEADARIAIEVLRGIGEVVLADVVEELLRCRRR